MMMVVLVVVDLGLWPSKITCLDVVMVAAEYKW